METVDLYLLSGTYRAVDGGVVVELYGKTRAGEPIVARYYGFRPYFVLTDPTDEARQRLKADSQVLELTDITTWVAGANHPALRVTVTNPWTVPEYRERYRRPGEENSVLACDIPFVHRFLYDKGLGLTVQFEAEEEPESVRSLYGVGRVVRVVSTDGHEIRPSEPFRPPVTVLSFDIENAIKERTIFTICGVVDHGGERRTTFRLSDEDERRILEKFVETVIHEDPDVITGYNIGGYDIPLLLERAEALKLPALAIGRDRSGPRDLGERLWRLSGRIIADAWWSARRELHPKQETLQFVARTLLGDKKLDVDRRRIEAEWAADRERVMEYCEHDADLALRILQRLRTIDKAADMATVAHLPLEDGLNGRTSLFIDAMLIPRADRESVGVPPTHRARRDAPIEGGYVHSIRAGLYNWVVVLDFKSMYPSIIISKNLCFTTLSPTGATIAPSGARFLTAEERPGLIPSILRELLADRDRFRKQATAATTAETRQYYDGLQNAVKVLMNSFYGVLASSFYRFTNKDIGAAITAFAREAITSIIQALETEGHEVVYSDTDSVFVRSPGSSLDEARRFGEELSRRFTQTGVTFEFQSVYEALFSHGAKKRYVGRTVWPKEELVIRGYESRRTDAFDFQSESLNEVFDLVLKGDSEAAVQRARELVRVCREGKVEPERLVIARSVRAEEEYNESTRDNLPFLRVFKQLKAEGYDVIPGMKVAWIVTDAGKTPQEVEPWIEGRPLTKPPDHEYYAERVAQTLARVTEVYNWDARALLGGNVQQRLDAHDAAGGGAPRRAPATLDTPVGELAKPAKRRHTTKALSEFE
ncbi:MAG TPA: DNA polymerase domain-containing protein [Thermoplasmata archaeon]|nr:DNA polymerase domain-containing protein [Thermoplasmata archaeon]